MTNDLLQRAKELLIEVQTYKHLQGRHNQLSHGYRLSKTPSLAKARQYRQEGLLQDYLGRARERQGTKPSKVRQGDKPKPEVSQDDEITAKYKAARKEYDAAVDEYLEKTKDAFSVLRENKKGKDIDDATDEINYWLDYHRDKIAYNESRIKELEASKIGKKKSEIKEIDKSISVNKELIQLNQADILKKQQEMDALPKKSATLPSEDSIEKAMLQIKDADNDLIVNTSKQRQAIMAYHSTNAEKIRQSILTEENKMNFDEADRLFSGNYQNNNYTVSQNVSNFGNSARNNMDKLSNLLRQDNSFPPLLTKKIGDQETEDSINMAYSFAGSNKFLAQQNLSVLIEDNVRSRADVYYNTSDLVIRKGAGSGVVIHEIGHMIEDADPTISHEVISFLDRRTKGENPTWLGKGFGSSEETKRDNFIDPYMGKIYPEQERGRPATEILSMGLQMFHENPYKLAKLDPDYFDFIYAVTRLNA